MGNISYIHLKLESINTSKGLTMSDNLFSDLIGIAADGHEVAHRFVHREQCHRVRVVAAGCVAAAGWCVSVGWCVAVRPSLRAGLQPVARLRRDEVHVDDAADLE